jgi:DNA-binding transcriptional LysR family regulator
MELHQLQALVTVAQERSFSRAARLLHIAQPAVSRKIKNLETELHVTLLRRSANGVALTDAGYRFLSDAEHILRLCSQTVEATQRLSGRGKDSLRIGYTTFFHHHLVGRVEKAFLQSHPAVALNVLDIPLTQQLIALELGSIDVGFALTVDPTCESTAVTATVISKHQLVVAISAGAQSSKRHLITAEDLCPINMKLDGNSPAEVASIENPIAALAYVGGGQGAVMVPREAMRLPHEGIVFRRTKPRLCCYTSVVWRRSERDRTIMEFVEIARRATVSKAIKKCATTVAKDGEVGP